MTEEYLETFNASPEEVEKHNLRETIESACIPHYTEEVRKIAQEIIDCPPKNFEALLETAKKIRGISDKIQHLSDFLDKAF